MKGWWHRYPEAFEAEKAALNALGCIWEIDKVAMERGRLVIHIVLLQEVPSNLTAEYPDTYPYFPPHVFLQGQLLQRHQHPVGRNLCLLAREGEDWLPGQDTLAGLLQEQFPKILAVNAVDLSSPFVAEIEDHVSEPLSSFLRYPPDCAIVVPDVCPSTDIPAGRLTLKVRPYQKDNLKEAPSVSGMVTMITDMPRKTLFTSSIIPSGYSESLEGFWLRLPERPPLEEIPNLANFLLKRMEADVPAVGKALKAGKRGQVFIAGFVYQDEMTWRATSDDWLFVAIRIQHPAKGPHSAQARLQLIRTDWGGEKAWMQRVPALRPVRAKSALIVGLGSLGSPLTLQLARAGIGVLHLIDFDQLQVGNTVRWALGWGSAGLSKNLALQAHILNDYPYTQVHTYDLRIGASNHVDEHTLSDYDRVRLVCEQVNLIIDASANYRVSHFLADLAQELGKSYLWLTTTHGASGGVVGRIIPGKTEGCWHCFQHKLADGSIRRPADTGGEEIQPGGCSQPTFIGAGVDSDEIALLAARLAISTLNCGESNGYPDFSWDVAVVDLQRAGLSIVPDWTPYTLKVSIACTTCNLR
ncbi:HesA/MoeB/ThiF family protein [Methylotuvimicrobium buryatense]|uniref:HesA/MoeB/ThiF family protein n=1 Tax=Methylotuvimicrobium buryatense TaxID=95641 RepID=UPI00164166DA|nr:ThiF family adenylyltransferase [Methylotuvimicrobium buryatense]